MEEDVGGLGGGGDGEGGGGDGEGGGGDGDGGGGDGDGGSGEGGGLGGGGDARVTATAEKTLSPVIVRKRMSPVCLTVTHRPELTPSQLITNGPTEFVAPDHPPHRWAVAPAVDPTQTSKLPSRFWYISPSSRLYTATSPMFVPAGTRTESHAFTS